MTPRTLNELIAAKTEDRNEKLRIFDQMNAILCNLVARSGHLKIDSRDPTPKDFAVMTPQKDDLHFDTPEELTRKLSMI